MDLSFYQALGLAMPALGSLTRASDIVGPTKRQRCMELLSAALGPWPRAHRRSPRTGKKCALIGIQLRQALEQD